MSPDLAPCTEPRASPLNPIFRKFISLPIAILLVVLAVSGVSACRNGLEPAALPAENDPDAIPTKTELPARNSTPSPKTSLPTIVPGKNIATNAGRAVSPEPPPSLQPFPDPPERDLYRLAAQLKPGIPADVPRIVNEKPVSYQQGRQDTFWLLDLDTLEYYQATFDLRLVTPRGYWYVDQEQEVRQEDLEEAVREFEDHIYPGVTAIFGAEWSPGVDNDPHLNILNSRLRGAGGYFSSSDEYPLLISPYSNQREIIYMNIGAFPIGTEAYLGVLAHELQHAVHWNADASEDTWVNEGLSDLAVALLGYGSGSSLRFLSSGPTSMVHWPISGIGSRANYGAASLFMQYLVEHYGNSEDLTPLVDQTADGINGINAYLKELGHRATFRQVFEDWSVANFLDRFQPELTEGPYTYSNLNAGATPTRILDSSSILESELPQFSTEYIQIRADSGPIRIVFQGHTHVPLLPVEVGADGCWWSNVGDSIDSRLTRALDLSDTPSPSLSYRIWYELEEDWDYAYVLVSLDEGKTWEIVETDYTSPSNPVGHSFGPGYTGESGEWLTENLDLGKYSGQQILLRFQYITDDAINGSGLCIKDFAGNGAENWQEGWQPEGFVLVDNPTPQQFSVQVIQVGPDIQVTAMDLDSRNSGALTIDRPEESDRLVVAVGALAAKTRQQASYELTVEE